MSGMMRRVPDKQTKYCVKRVRSDRPERCVLIVNMHVSIYIYIHIYIYTGMLLLHVIDGCSQHPGLHRYALPLDANHVDRLTPILRDGDNLDVVLLPDFLYILGGPWTSDVN